MIIGSIIYFIIHPPPREKSHGLVVEIYNHPSPPTARKFSWSRGGNLKLSIHTPPQETSRGLMVKIQNHPSPTMRKISWSRGDNELGPCVRSSNQLVDKKISVPHPPREKSCGLMVKV